MTASIAGVGTAFIAGCTAMVEEETESSDGGTEDQNIKEQDDMQGGGDQNHREVQEGESIQEAIDEADAGGTVEVLPGTYDESITINKELTVTAPDGATLDGVDIEDTAAITIADSGVVIDGFEIIRYPDGGIRTDTDIDDGRTRHAAAQRAATARLVPLRSVS